ncbi:hypothetical protein YQE_09937, partial [Dendroctonus ponderosae]
MSRIGGPFTSHVGGWCNLFRRHLRLDNLRTLILADNQFNRIQLSTDDNGDISGTDDEEPERVGALNLAVRSLPILAIDHGSLFSRDLSSFGVLTVQTERCPELSVHHVWPCFLFDPVLLLFLLYRVGH